MDNNKSVKYQIFEKFMNIVNAYKNKEIKRIRHMHVLQVHGGDINNIVMISHIKDAITNIIKQADKPSDDIVEKMFVALVEKILNQNDDILSYMVRICDTDCIIVNDDMHKYMNKFVMLLNEACNWIMIGSSYIVSVSEELYKESKKELIFN